MKKSNNNKIVYHIAKSMLNLSEKNMDRFEDLLAARLETEYPTYDIAVSVIRNTSVFSHSRYDHIEAPCHTLVDEKKYHKIIRQHIERFTAGILATL